jgi:stress-induced morphogen
MTFHMKKCGKDKKFQCEVCAKKFTSKYAWQRHNIVFHLDQVRAPRQEVQTL